MIKIYTVLALLFSLYGFVYFVNFGLTNKPILGDSHDYHIPIAQSYLNGQIFSVPKNANSFINYPGATEAILIPFLVSYHSPNFFCLFGYLILLVLLKRLGNHFGLSNYLSIIFAATFTSTLAVFRQIPTQSVDIWMSIWFVWLVLLLEKQKKSLLYFLTLGIAFGMLVGSKYSGPGYMAILLLLYGKNILQVISLKKTILFLIPFSIIGLFWYVRNFLAWGSPIYPGTLFMMKGLATLDLPRWMLWKLILQGHIYSFLESLVSEYLIWAFSFIPGLIFIIIQFKNKTFNMSDKLTRVIVLGIFVFIASLPLSFKPGFENSNARYLLPLFIPFILSVFLIAKKHKKEKEIALVALLNIFFATSYMLYHPKLIVIYFIFVGLIYIKRKPILEKIISL